MKVVKEFDSLTRAEGFIEGVEFASEVAEATGGKAVKVLGEAYMKNWDSNHWYVDVDYDVGAVNLGFGDHNDAEGS